jgi:transcriptional regulator with XRE-family HTH domain
MPAAKKTNGKALRAIRTARGLKLNQLAARLDKLGAATAKPSHLCNIETGRRDASDALRNAIALVLGIDVAAIETRPVPHDAAA